MTQYQRRYKAATALQMILESGSEDSDDNVSGIDDDDDYIASPDVDAEIEDHVSDTNSNLEESDNNDVEPGLAETVADGRQEEGRHGQC